MRMSKAKEKRQREAREGRRHAETRIQTLLAVAVPERHCFRVRAAADVLQTLQELQQECTAPWIKSILERAEASLRPAAEAILRAEAHSQASAQQPYPGPPQQTLQGLTEEQRHEDKPNRVRRAGLCWDRARPLPQSSSRVTQASRSVPQAK